ncbi:hypothetical protein [Nocardioides sp. LHG3406-4]|uniref:hypothetical protein n=1 Tax=Nocardioides sp. LHG3406-4 TaxID=2804575 RepID=UPI003CFBBD87
MDRPLDERTISALGQIVDFAAAGAKLVRRGHEAYGHDPMLRLAGEAIMRRFDDAVLRLDEAFLAAHPSIDWAALTMTRDLDNSPAGSYVDYWEFLETSLPVEVRKVRHILDDWRSRPLPAREDDADDDHPLAVTPPPRVDRGPGPAPIDDDDFHHVVERLNEWAESATASGDDGPIDVVYPSGRMVRIVMSADDLSSMLVVSGTIDEALFHIMASLRELPEDTPYLVYGNNYTLVPSAEPTLRPPRS